MTPTVHHYFPKNSSNVGDTLVAHAIQQALRRHFGKLEFVNIAVNDRFKKDGQQTTGLLGQNIIRTNREADFVVVGGSNLLEPRKVSRGKPVFHWGIQTNVEALERLHVPVLLLGMGTGSDWGQPIRSYSSQAKLEVQLLHRKAFAAAVRDMPTKVELAKIQVQVECTGCPVTFLTDRPIAKNDQLKALMVSMPPARILKTWSGKWFMLQTINYVRWLQSEAIPFVITLHERADLDFAPHWIPPGIPVFYTEDVPELIERYEDSCGVIGFRLHAALLGLGLGKPIIPVNVDWRGRAFSQTYALDAMALEPGKWGHFKRLKRQTTQLLNGDSTLYTTLNAQKQIFLNRYHQFLSQAATNYLRGSTQLHSAVA
ncbi:MAG: polysaccharide pyruvyl transferase family protein [Gemmatales bacterium]